MRYWTSWEVTTLRGMFSEEVCSVSVVFCFVASFFFR